MVSQVGPREETKERLGGSTGQVIVAHVPETGSRGETPGWSGGSDRSKGKVWATAFIGGSEEKARPGGRNSLGLTSWNNFTGFGL